MKTFPAFHGGLSDVVWLGLNGGGEAVVKILNEKGRAKFSSCSVCLRVTIRRAGISAHNLQ